jgi:hypothetical protein
MLFLELGRDNIPAPIARRYVEAAIGMKLKQIEL